MANLKPVGKAAIYEALLMVIAIDRVIEPAEQVHFDAEVNQIPWDLSPELFDLIQQKARLRIKSTLQRDAWLAWIKEIALLLQDPQLREKVLLTQATIAFKVTRELDLPVKGLLNEFGRVFGMTEKRMHELRAELGPLAR